MSNEVMAVSIPQVEDDIQIFEKIKVLLNTHQFVYLDMKPEYNSEAIVYRFQRKENER